MKRTAALFFAILFLCSFTSCFVNRANPPCSEVLTAITDKEVSLPAGKYFSFSAPEGDEQYLSDDLIARLFGNGSYPKVAADWVDCALYLSLGKSPCEFAVILCKNRDAAHDTATLLHIRLSAIKLTKTDPEYAKMLENASVTLIGNYALLVISNDPETALRAAKRVIL